MTTHAPASTVTAPIAPAQDLRSLIAGRWLDPAGAPLVSTDPARLGEVVAQGTLAGEAELDAAVRGAAEAFPGWARTPFPVRGKILGRAVDLLAAHAEQWGAELAREEGKTLAEGIGEVRRAQRSSGSRARRDCGRWGRFTPRHAAASRSSWCTVRWARLRW